MLVMEWCSTLRGEEGKKSEQEPCWTVSFAVHHLPLLPTLHAQNVATKVRVMASSLPVWTVFSLVIVYISEYGVSPAYFLAKARGGTCTLAVSDPTEDVLRRASFLFENGFGGYNVFNNNCEDFAIYCKTGLLIITSISVGRSGQAASCLAAASAVISTPLRFMTTSFSGLAAVGYGMYCVSRLVSDIGVRRDVSKVPVEKLVAIPDIDEPENVGALIASPGIDEPEKTSEVSKED